MSRTPGIRFLFALIAIVLVASTLASRIWLDSMVTCLISATILISNTVFYLPP
jgi:hypothetical protein